VGLATRDGGGEPRRSKSENEYADCLLCFYSNSATAPRPHVACLLAPWRSRSVAQPESAPPQASNSAPAARNGGFIHPRASSREKIRFGTLPVHYFVVCCKLQICLLSNIKFVQRADGVDPFLLLCIAVRAYYNNNIVTVVIEHAPLIRGFFSFFIPRHVAQKHFRGKKRMTPPSPPLSRKTDCGGCCPRASTCTVSNFWPFLPKAAIGR